MLFGSLADINMLCGMTIICCLFADFDDFDSKVDSRIVMVLEAGLPPAVVLSISAVIVNYCNYLFVETFHLATFFFLSSWRFDFYFKYLVLISFEDQT